VALADLLGEPLRRRPARCGRGRPAAQHAAAVRASAELCGATLEGVEVGARAFVFRPGPRVAGGRFVWEIGTAGSATMLALGILPLACLAEAPIDAIIRGGIVQDFAPPPEHLIHVLAPLVARRAPRRRLVRRGARRRSGSARDQRRRSLIGAPGPPHPRTSGSWSALAHTCGATARSSR
jgi:RNA 3'-terminal phosphate cyclase (ATP)